jgi:hypothetical protein
VVLLVLVCAGAVALCMQKDKAAGGKQLGKLQDAYGTIKGKLPGRKQVHSTRAPPQHARAQNAQTCMHAFGCGSQAWSAAAAVSVSVVGLKVVLVGGCQPAAASAPPVPAPRRPAPAPAIPGDEIDYRHAHTRTPPAACVHCGARSRPVCRAAVCGRLRLACVCAPSPPRPRPDRS